MKDPLALYHQYHSGRGDERAQLFDILRREFAVSSCLYPGSFVHVTPSFFFPVVTYVDADSRARGFFQDPRVVEFVARNRHYPQLPRITFLAQDYSTALPTGSDYDLLLSQYGGFVSEPCKQHVRPGGLLVANNSHGDAGLAAIDPDWRLIAVVDRRGERFRLSTQRLEEYFVPKRGAQVTREELLRAGRGIGYVRPAADYVFERV